MCCNVVPLSEFLDAYSYWVCEKSDGVRVLVFINRVENSTDVYLVGAQRIPFDLVEASSIQIDRHDHYRCVTGYYFPFYEDPRRPLGDTILDGELVIDTEPMADQVCVSVFSIALVLVQPGAQNCRC